MNVSFNSFSELSPQQILAIFKLRSDVFVVEQKCVYLDPDQTDLEAKHLLIESNNILVAYARVYFDDSAHIGRIIVAPEHRRKGHSITILDAAIDWIQNKNESADIVLSAQVYLSDFYINRGFLIKGPMYLEDGIPHLSMSYQR